jgi:hypothetical protein
VHTAIPFISAVGVSAVGVSAVGVSAVGVSAVDGESNHHFVTML